MPVLTLPIISEGPLVNIEVGWSRARAKVLRKTLQPVPPPVQFEALIDTGADTTCLDPTIIAQLGFLLGGITLANVPATGGLIPALEHDVSLRILHPSGNGILDLLFTDLLILELELGTVGYQALLGQDVLAQCDFLYQGPSGQFQLTY